MRKVTVLASRIEEDCRQNIQTLIEMAKKLPKNGGRLERPNVGCSSGLFSHHAQPSIRSQIDELMVYRTSG